MAEKEADVVQPRSLGHNLPETWGPGSVTCGCDGRHSGPHHDAAQVMSRPLEVKKPGCCLPNSSQPHCNAETAIPAADGEHLLRGQTELPGAGVGADGAPPGGAASQGWGGRLACVAGALLRWSLLQDTAHPLCMQQTGARSISLSSY